MSDAVVREPALTRLDLAVLAATPDGAVKPASRDRDIIHDLKKAELLTHEVGEILRGLERFGYVCSRTNRYRQLVWWRTAKGEAALV